MTAVYYLFCAAGVFFAYLAEKKNNRKIFLILSILFVGFIAGVRARTVGIDTDTYYNFIDWAANGILTNIEPGFIFVSKIFWEINKSAEPVVFFCSFLTVVFTFIRFWTLRNKASYSLMVFLYLALYFQFSLNIMRQFLAISILFLGTYFLENKKYIWYFVSIVLSVLFHMVGFVGVVLFVVYYWYNNASNTIKKMFFSFLILASVPAVLYGALLLAEEYSSYIEASSADVGLLVFAKLALLLIFVYFNQQDFFLKTQSDRSVKTMMTIYLIGLISTFIGYIYPYVDRVGLYFMIFEPVCLAVMCKRRQHNIFKMLIFMLAAFMIYTNYTANGHGVLPYDWIF